MMVATVKPVKQVAEYSPLHYWNTTQYLLSTVNDNVCFQITSINTQVEVCVQLPGDVLSVLDDGAISI